MSIIKSSAEGCIISHRDYIKINILNDDLTTKTSKIVKLDPDLFEIHCPFKSRVKMRTVKTSRIQSPPPGPGSGSNSTEAASEIILKNSKTPICEFGDTCGNVVASKVQKLSDVIIREGIALGFFQNSSPQLKMDNNAKARKAANNFYENVSALKKFPKFIREFPESVGGKMILFDEMGNFQNFLIPEDSSAYCEDVENLKDCLRNCQFSFIVMDPPWRNKYIRRRKRKQSEAGYQMLDDWSIKKIPMKSITKDNALVAIWCTNSEAHQRQVIEHFFPDWNVQYITTWYWLKVTTEGVPICPFNTGTNKQPFETIILGRKRRSPSSISTNIIPERIAETLTAETKVLVSVPSSIHSHKPPLTEVFRPFIYENELDSTNCCEIFARYILPRFTCFGNEVVKLMHESLYISDHEDENN